jgi:hypothetical protein
MVKHRSIRKRKPTGSTPSKCSNKKRNQGSTPVSMQKAGPNWAQGSPMKVDLQPDAVTATAETPSTVNVCHSTPGLSPVTRTLLLDPYSTPERLMASSLKASIENKNEIEKVENSIADEAEQEHEDEGQSRPQPQSKNSARGEDDGTALTEGSPSLSTSLPETSREELQQDSQRTRLRKERAANRRSLQRPRCHGQY